MRHIPLTRGLFAVVDDADFGWLSTFTWHASSSLSVVRRAGGYKEKVYAVRHSGPRRLRMHREIYSQGASIRGEIDHRNGDTLDNRRSNLRDSTRSQNNANRQVRGGSSMFKGVSWCSCVGKPWFCKIKKDGEQYFLGRFAAEEDAAVAYNVAAIKLFGAFACLNDLEAA